MKSLLIVVVLALAFGSAVAADFLDTFDYPDGSFPTEYTWTGDPRGGGYFEVHNGEFTHVDGGHVHYFRPGDVNGFGVYSFFVTGTEWVFAWRITPDNPDAGRCLVFYHNDHWYPNAYTFAEFSWTTLGGYPEGQYMWHNGTELAKMHHETGPLTGWHEVVIDDHGDEVHIYVDSVPIFEYVPFEPIPDGYVGLGCDGSGVMTPAFDAVEFWLHGAPVEESSWGSIKALYR